MARVFVAMGGNLGDVRATFAQALAELTAGPLLQVRASSLYRTRALVDPSAALEQPDYWNAVLGAHTELAPEALLDVLLAMERRHGRDRSTGRRWAARTLDLDLLLYDDLQLDTPRLRVPHPGITQRSFVLRPLLEVEPEVEIPGFGRAARALAALGDPEEGIREVRAWDA